MPSHHKYNLRKPKTRVDSEIIEESVPIISTWNLSHWNCIFCGRNCSPGFAIQDGKLVKFMRQAPQHKSPLFEDTTKNCSLLKQQLVVMDIMINLLDIGKQYCTELLLSFDGQLHPKYWFRACEACQEDVDEFTLNLNQDEDKRSKIKARLVGQISGSNQAKRMEFLTPFWSEIRRQALGKIRIIDIWSSEQGFI